jgi:signal transduction histidine kinase
MMKKGLPHLVPNLHIKAMISAHLIWLVMVCLLGAWWDRLLLRQAGKIAELEGKLGLSVDITQGQWHRTQNMLYWESLTFFGLLLACTGFLFWLYWRDMKRAKGIQAFFASVTHELRTPLTSIRLQAESIAESLMGEVSQGNLVRRLLEDTIRLEAQVERTLELARVEGGGPVYNQPLQIKPWLDRFLKTWTADYRDRVELKLGVDDVLIEADPTAMQVIFKNLLENSVRHSKRGGISLLLKDDGQGFQGDQKNLGKLFHKAPSSQGTGVGLYLVKILMKRMGGWVQFNFNSGFEVSFGFMEGKLNG